ncbi:MAG: metal-sensitive transcriptional regulator [Candidatus Fermentithermobacillus carboniphilus]|uniref:Metal-sensitive transcriptional regulator n=1 Tax=Candidatus Fermentithermobacillus carboniphilus TaxID=3085328 RepID=A0AAT9LDS4_9FIRM|nr:MAG: metal-sensitive transcriptional regulator [Candidatus Fermentithermobacillus carboniphilus]
MPSRGRRVHRENKSDLLNRLKRVEGQIRGISRMIEEDEYCVDILNQVAAARAALGKIGLMLLETHARGCVVRGIKDGDEEATVTELMDVIKRFV